MDTVPDAHLSQLVLPTGQILMHLLLPEVHGIVHDFDGASLDDTCTHWRVAEVLARLDDARVVEAKGACMDETCLDQGLPELSSCFEFMWFLLLLAI